MINFIKNILSPKVVNFKKLLNDGAEIIDVRTPAEFDNGHIKNSRNIPLQNLVAEMKNMDVKKPIITCCASGMRSASAKSLLKENGFEVYNGGGWLSLEKKLEK